MRFYIDELEVYNYCEENCCDYSLQFALSDNLEAKHNLIVDQFEVLSIEIDSHVKVSIEHLNLVLIEETEFTEIYDTYVNFNSIDYVCRITVNESIA